MIYIRVFPDFMADHAAASLLFFMLVWYFMVKKGAAQKISNWWAVFGVFATMAFLAATKIGLAIIFGGSIIAKIDKNPAIFHTMLPIAFSLIFCIIFKSIYFHTKKSPQK